MTRKDLLRRLFAARKFSSSATLPLEAPTGIASCPFAMKSSAGQPKIAVSSNNFNAASSKSFDQIPAAKGLPFIGTTIDLIRAGGAARIHEYCDMRHKTLGPIFKETMGNDECVFVADSDLMQKIYSSESQYPKHMVPESWTIYNKEKGIQRGLFFM